MTKDEWLNLCTRVRTKLPKNAQLDIWSQLAWRDKALWQLSFALVFLTPLFR